jgi:hypothetical protein
MEICTKCGKPIIRGFEGHRYGLQALKPSFEPICVFQKPYEGRPIDCITTTGAGTLNIDGGRFGEEEVTVNVLEQWSGLGQVQRPDYNSTRSWEDLFAKSLEGIIYYTFEDEVAEVILWYIYEHYQAEDPEDKVIIFGEEQFMIETSEDLYDLICLVEE